MESVRELCFVVLLSNANDVIICNSGKRSFRGEVYATDMPAHITSLQRRKATENIVVGG